VQCFRFPDEIVMHLLYAEATSSEMEPVEHGWSEDGNESYCDIELVVALGFRLDHSKDLKVGGVRNLYRCSCSGDIHWVGIHRDELECSSQLLR
jgi:hypothetical protein